MLWQMRALVAPREEQVQLERSKAKLERLQSKQPQKIGAKTAFVSNLLTIAGGDGFKSRYTGPGRGKRAVARHGCIWRSMTFAQRDAYELEAKVLRAEKEAALEENIAKAVAEVRGYRLMVDTSGSPSDRPLGLAACKFSPKDLVEFDALWEDSRFGRGAVHAARLAAAEPIGPIPAIEQEALAQAKQIQRPARRSVPAGVVAMANLRDYMDNCIVQLTDDKGTRYFMFMYAVLRPAVFIGFLEVFPEIGDEVLAALRLHFTADQEWEHSFWFAADGFVYTNGNDNDFSDDPEVLVLDGAVAVAATRVCSDSDWVPLEVFEERCGQTRRCRATEPGGVRPRRPGGASLAENPWLADLLGVSSGARSLPTTAEVKDDEDLEGQEEQDFDPAEVLAMLADARASFAERAGDNDDTEHFAWTLRGGCWTQQNRGMCYDSFRSYAATPAAKAFMNNFHMALIATFSLSRYGEHACAVFCRYWVARMTFFKRLADSSDEDGEVIFSDGRVSAFEEPADFVELCSTAGGHVLARAQGLRALVPSGSSMRR